eukprot:2114005-Rhodomonas_salina.1
MAEGGCFISEIDRVLRAKAIADGTEVSWTYDDLRHRFLPSSSQHLALDASGFVEWLLEREWKNGLGSKHTTDEAGKLNKAFFVLEDADDLWSFKVNETTVTNVLLFDTSHGTNRYGLKLGLLVTVGNDGVTHILAASVLLNEDKESFQWVFECFTHFFKHPPHVILTDGDPAMAFSIRKVWPECVHQLCTHHLGQNIIKNVRPLFCGPGSNKRFRKWLSTWWTIAKNSDQRSQSSFDTEWAILREEIESEYATKPHLDKAFASAIGQATRLYDNRKAWAARWTWSVFTAGCHSTQRQEAVHSGLKRWLLRPGITLLALAKEIVNYRDNVAAKGEEKTVKQKLKNLAETTDLPPLLLPLVDKMSPHYIKLTLAQWKDSQNYCIGPLQGDPDRSTDQGWKLATRIIHNSSAASSSSRGTQGNDDEQEEESPTQQTDSELALLMDRIYDIDLGLPGSTGVRMHDVSYACTKTECTCSACGTYLKIYTSQTACFTLT